MVYFVTGIDTGVGKTWVTGLLLRYLLSRGIKAISSKLVQTGCTGLSEDVLLHRKIAGQELLVEDREGLTCPYVFPKPASPHWAASQVGQSIDEAFLATNWQELERRFEVVLCEGAGGFSVPLTLDRTIADFVSNQGWPTFVVSVPRLGALNHTLLTLDALRASKVALAGLIMNQSDAWGQELKDLSLEFFRHKNLPLVEINTIQDTESALDRACHNLGQFFADLG